MLTANDIPHFLATRAVVKTAAGEAAEAAELYPGNPNAHDAVDQADNAERELDAYLDADGTLRDAMLAAHQAIVRSVMAGDANMPLRAAHGRADEKIGNVLGAHGLRQWDWR